MSVLYFEMNDFQDKIVKWIDLKQPFKTSSVYAQPETLADQNQWAKRWNSDLK